MGNSNVFLYQQLSITFDLWLMRSTTSKHSNAIGDFPKPTGTILQTLTRESKEHLDELISNHLPNGAGIEDCQLDYEASKRDCLVFTLCYHRMSEVGFYCGYSDHQIVLRPSLSYDFDLSVTCSEILIDEYEDEENEGTMLEEDVTESVNDYLGEWFSEAMQETI